MNSLLQEEFPLTGTQFLRYELLDVLKDEDLTYKLPGDNPTFGELLGEIGRIEQIYLESFKTFNYDLNLKVKDPNVTGSVANLRAWYQALDSEFETVVAGFSEDEIQNKQVDRGHGFSPSLFVQFQIFREALYILYGKASVYMRALQKPLSEKWLGWIG